MTAENVGAGHPTVQELRRTLADTYALQGGDVLMHT